MLASRRFVTWTDWLACELLSNILVRRDQSRPYKVLGI